jgi:DNA-binding NtrC family response regulator
MLTRIAAQSIERRPDRMVRWPTSGWIEARRLSGRLAVALGEEGFVVCRPAEADAPRARAALAGRHLALLVFGRADRRAAARLVARLALESARAHLVVDVSSRRRLAPIDGSPGRRDARLLAARLEVAVREGHGCAVRACDWALRLRRMWMRTASGGTRDAGPADVSVTPPSFRSESWMPLLDVLPRALQVVAEAEDDQAALAGAAAWARTDAGADLVAFVGAAGGPVLAIEGRRGDRVSDEERAAVAAAHDLTRLARPDGVSMVAAIRYSGVPVGAVVVRGQSSAEPQLTEAARVLSVVCAPALRARLETVDLARSADRVAELVGRSPALDGVRHAICRAAVTPFPVLIEGESGTGKELVARAIHRLSPRRDRRFAAVNCAALSDELVDTELFGHSRGAFTGAVGPRAGLFEDAHGGSLFLDEVAELSARAQAKLLRAIQEREIRRVGENATRVIDTRLLAATNRRLGAGGGDGFREDLLFRLAVIRIELPPLRDRVEDVAPLALAFWGRMQRDAGTHALLGPDALMALAAYHWPGNVRELQNVMARVAVVAPPRGRVSHRHVASAIGAAAAPAAAGQPLGRARATWERQAVAAALTRHGGRRVAAARELGMSRQGLTKAIRRLRLDETGPSRAGVA